MRASKRTSGSWEVYLPLTKWLRRVWCLQNADNVRADWRIELDLIMVFPAWLMRA